MRSILPWKKRSEKYTAKLWTKSVIRESCRDLVCFSLVRIDSTAEGKRLETWSTLDRLVSAVRRTRGLLVQHQLKSSQPRLNKRGALCLGIELDSAILPLVSSFRLKFGYKLSIRKRCRSLFGMGDSPFVKRLVNSPNQAWGQGPLTSE
jgi:hypothetical protein